MELRHLHAFGVDDIGSAFFARWQDVSFAWVILSEHKWVISRERRGLSFPMSLQIGHGAIFFE